MKKSTSGQIWQIEDSKDNLVLVENGWVVNGHWKFLPRKGYINPAGTRLKVTLVCEKAPAGKDYNEILDKFMKKRNRKK